MNTHKQPLTVRADSSKTSKEHGHKAQVHYVATMFSIVARSLVAASHVDEQMQATVAQLPTGIIIAMTVFGTSIGFVLQVVQADKNAPKHLQLVEQAISDGKLLKQVDRPTLRICFKHISHAYTVLSFQESTATAFAYDRMIVDGDVNTAVVMVRCLNRLESVILPKVLARRAIKSYPQDLNLPQKLELALKIYGKLMASYLMGSKL